MDDSELKHTLELAEKITVIEKKIAKEDYIVKEYINNWINTCDDKKYSNGERLSIILGTKPAIRFLPDEDNEEFQKEVMKLCKDFLSRMDTKHCNKREEYRRQLREL